MNRAVPLERMFARVLIVVVALIATTMMPPSRATAGVGADYPETPYAATDYTEPFRGQFHFSPPNGWMNDINGPVYYRGVYHMFFQSNPHSLTPNNDIHWGHATSTDLVHWTQQPIALEPGVHAPGGPESLLWSGSAWVDTTNATGLKNGPDDPILLFTGTMGVSIAYSTDGAKTFSMYGGGSQVISTGSNVSRDPKVQWDPAHNRWVLALFDYTGSQGVSFYTSTNLLTWTKVDHLAASWFVECPDIYQVAVDGDPSKMKWVLQDAGGRYVVGDFGSDGKFNADPGSPQNMESGDVRYGGTWYASQTFNQLPNNRVVQIGWQGGNQGATWTGNASFPVDVGLKTFADGIHLTRNPVPEISTIHTTSQMWGSQTITPDPASDPFQGVTADAYEIQATFETGGATAASTAFSIHGRADGSRDATVAYNLGTGTLTVDNAASTIHPTFSVSMPAIAGSVKVRLLVDRGQLEVFGNDGRAVVSDNVNFDSSPSSQKISLTATGGSVTVSLLNIFRLASAWRASHGGASPNHAIVSTVAQADKASPTDVSVTKCLDVDGPTGNVQIWDCWGGINQSWLLNTDGSLVANGLCMQLPAGQTANRTLVNAVPCTGSTNQKWSKGNFGSLINQAAGRCLDVDYANYTNGQRLQVYDCVGSRNQSWVGPTTSYTLSGAVAWNTSNKCLDRDVASGRAQIWDCLGNFNQLWTLNQNGTLTSAGVCLELPSGQTANHTLVDVGDCTGGDNQVWSAGPNQSLVNKSSNRCLDLADANQTNGRQLQVYDCVGGPNQYWTGP